MQARFRESFARDLGKISDRGLLHRIQEVIERVERAQSLAEIAHLKKFKGTAGKCYRIRVGEHRIGLVLEANVLTFVRCLSRKELYRYFP